MRRIKLFIYSVLTLVVFAIIAGGVVSLFFDLNGLKPTLAEAAKEQTGRDLAIDGDITLSLFPRPRATASAIRLSNVDGGSEAEVVTVDVASVQVSWLPLLTGTLDVRQIHAAGVRVLIEKNAAGTSSLAFEPAASDEPEGEPAALPDLLDVRDVAIVVRGENETVFDVSRVTVRPTPGETTFAIAAERDGKPVNATGTVGDLLSLGGPAPFPIDLEIGTGEARTNVVGSVNLGGETPTLDLAVKSEGPSLADLSPLVGAELPATAPFTLEAGLAGVLDNIRLHDAAFLSDGVEIAGNAAFDQTGARPMITATLSAAQLDLSAFMADDGAPQRDDAGSEDANNVLSDAPLPLAVLRQVDSDITFTATSLQLLGVSLADVGFAMNGRAGLIEITRLDGALPEGTLTGAGRLDARQDTASLDLEVSVSGLDVAKVLDALDIPAQSARRAAARATIASQGATSRAIADNLTAQIGLSDLEVTLENSASLILTDAAARFEGRNSPVELSVTGAVRGEKIDVTGRLDPLANYRHGEPYAFSATATGAGATLRLEADMQAAMVEGLKVRVAAEGATLSQLSRLLDSDLPAVGPYSVSGLLSLEEGVVSLGDVQARLGESDVGGSLMLTYGDGLPGVVADLRAELIDLASFSEPASAEGGARAEAQAAAFLSDAPLDLGPLFGITADLQFAATEIRVADLRLRDVALESVLDSESLRIERFVAKVDGNPAEASGALRWTGTAAQVAVDAKISGIDVDSLVAQSGLGDRLDLGPLNIELTLESTGNSRAALFDNVVGDAVARDFRLSLQTDDRVPHDPVTLEALRVATAGAASPLTVTANGTLGSEALDIKATLEPLARLRRMEPVPMDVSLSTPTSHIRVSGKAPDRNRPSYVDFSVSAEGRIVREFAALGGLSLNPEGPWKIAGALSVDDGLVTLSDAQVAIGTSDVAGSFELRDNDGTTFIRAQVTSKRLALTDFVPEEPRPPPTADAAATDAPVFDTAPFDLAPLRAIDLDIGVQVDAFFGRSIAGDGLSMRLKAKDGLLTLDRLAAAVGGQQVLAKGAFNARGAAAEATVSLVGGPFDLGALLLELSPSAGSQNVIQLPVNVDVELSSTGASAHDLAASMNGKIDVVGGKGFVQQRAFRFLDQGLLRQLAPWAEERTRTNINCFVGRFDVADGVATSRGLLLDAEFISVSGRGSIDLGRETLDLTLTPRPKEVRLLDLAVPVAVTGKLNNPSFAPTTAGTAKKVATTLGVLVNPLVLLVPVIEGVTAEKNPCLAAIDNAGKSEQGSGEGAVGGVIKGIGEGVEGIGRGIGRIFGGNKE